MTHAHGRLKSWMLKRSNADAGDSLWGRELQWADRRHSYWNELCLWWRPNSSQWASQPRQPAAFPSWWQGLCIGSGKERCISAVKWCSPTGDPFAASCSCFWSCQHLYIMTLPSQQEDEIHDGCRTMMPGGSGPRWYGRLTDPAMQQVHTAPVDHYSSSADSTSCAQGLGLASYAPGCQVGSVLLSIHTLSSCTVIQSYAAATAYSFMVGCREESQLNIKPQI